MNIKKSKKGTVLGYLTIGFIFIAIVQFWVNDLIVKPERQKFGEAQIELMNAYQEAEKALYYVDTSSKLSIERAMQELPRKGGYAYGSQCGSYNGYTLWNSEGKNCLPTDAAISSNFEATTNKFLSRYFYEYPDVNLPIGSYQIFIKQKGTDNSLIEITGVPQNEKRIRLSIGKDSMDGDDLPVVDDPGASPVQNKYPKERFVLKKTVVPNSKLIETFGAKEEVEANLVPVTIKGKSILVHKKAKKSFEAAAKKLESTTYTIRSIGAYEWQFIPETNSLSWHSFGIAVDINPATNPICGTYDPLKQCKADYDFVTDMPQDVVEAFKSAGFTWGGEFPHANPMHFQWEGWI